MPVYNQSINHGKYKNNGTYNKDEELEEWNGVQLFNTERKLPFKGGEVILISYNPKCISVWDLVDSFGFIVKTIMTELWDDILELVFSAVEENLEIQAIIDIAVQENLEIQAIINENENEIIEISDSSPVLFLILFIIIIYL